MAYPHSDEVIPTFAERLERARRKYGLTQTKLARESGLSNSQVSELETGKEPRRLSITPVVKCLKGLIKLYVIQIPDEINNWLRSYFTDRSEDPLSVEELGSQGKELLELLETVETNRLDALTEQEYLAQLSIDLIGRRKEISEIFSILRDQRTHRFLTLTGLPGVGKTALALQILHLPQTQKYFTYVLPMLILEGIYDVDEVLRKIREQLPLDMQARILLVLDNCEQIKDTMGLRNEIYNRLFVEYPQLTILATSQTPFSESDYLVAALDRPSTRDEPLGRLQAYSAVQLLLKHTMQHSKDGPFQIIEENVKTVAALCIALNGLPLALKIAGPLIKPYGIKAVCEMVLDRSLWKVKDTLPLSERQQTLLNLFDAGYNLLGEQEQKLFRRLAVFPPSYNLVEGISIHDAAVICSLNDLPADECHPGFVNALNILFARNLISISNNRIHMAHNTLRDFGRSKLDDPEVNESVRMRDQFIDYIDSLDLSEYTEFHNRNVLEKAAKEASTLASTLASAQAPALPMYLPFWNAFLKGEIDDYDSLKSALYELLSFSRYKPKARWLF